MPGGFVERGAGSVERNSVAFDKLAVQAQQIIGLGAQVVVLQVVQGDLPVFILLE